MNVYFARLNGYEPILFDLMDRSEDVAVVIQRLAMDSKFVTVGSVSICERDEDFCLCVNAPNGDHVVIDVDSRHYCPIVTRLIRAGVKVDFI